MIPFIIFGIVAAIFAANPQKPENKKSVEYEYYNHDGHINEHFKMHRVEK